MPQSLFRFGPHLAFCALAVLTLFLSACDAGQVNARTTARKATNSSIVMPTELRTALEEALPTGQSGGQLPDADEAFLYGVGIGAIQELYVEAFHPREVAMAGLVNLGTAPSPLSVTSVSVSSVSLLPLAQTSVKVVHGPSVPLSAPSLWSAPSSPSALSVSQLGPLPPSVCVHRYRQQQRQWVDRHCHRQVRHCGQLRQCFSVSYLRQAALAVGFH